MKKPVVVTITGAAGNIGYALAFRVAAGQMLGTDQPVDLNLLEVPAAVGAVFEETKKRGVLIGKGGVYGNVIRTGLMLNAGKSQVDEMVDVAFAHHVRRHEVDDIA